MSEPIFIIALIGGLILSMLAIIVGIWANPRKGAPGWIMAASTVFLFFGIAGFAVLMVIEFTSYLQDLSEDPLWDGTFACLTLTAVLFTTGFLWDRIRRCAGSGP